MTSREKYLGLVSVLFDGRPTRWAEPNGAYDGSDRTLEVFNVDHAERRDLMRRLRRIRADMEQELGGPVVVLFHDRKESARLYAVFVEQALRAAVVDDISKTASTTIDTPTPLSIDLMLSGGSTSLPRRAA